MTRITWENSELEVEIQSDDFRYGFGDYTLSLKLLINNINIIGNPNTNLRLFFTQLYGAFQYLDPKRLGSKNLHIENDNCISGEGFNFYLTPKTEYLNMILIKYQRTDMVGEYKQIQVPFKEFIEGVLISNEHLFKQAFEIRPDLKADTELIELKEEMEIIKKWYADRFIERKHTDNMTS